MTENLSLTIDSANIEDIDECEAACIENYDYEKASYLYEAKLQLRKASIQDQTQHYDKQLEEYHEKTEVVFQEQMNLIQEQYEEDYDSLRQELLESIEALSEEQEQEMYELEQRWRSARQIEQKKIDEKVANMLESSQHLARVHKYSDAIKMRDQANKIKDTVVNPEIRAVDEIYEQQFESLLERHQMGFDELIRRHDAKVSLLREESLSGEKTAKMSLQVDKACAPLQIINTVMSSTNDNDATLAVVKSVSPRSKKMQGQDMDSFMDE